MQEQVKQPGVVPSPARPCLQLLLRKSQARHVWEAAVMPAHLPGIPLCLPAGLSRLTSTLVHLPRLFPQQLILSLLF